MGVKISLPPPGAGGPAGPDAGAVTREMQLAGNVRAGVPGPYRAANNKRHIAINRGGGQDPSLQGKMKIMPEDKP